MTRRTSLSVLAGAPWGAAAWLGRGVDARAGAQGGAGAARSSKVVLCFVASPTLPGWRDDFERVLDLVRQGVEAVNAGLAEGDPGYVTFDPPPEPVRLDGQADQKFREIDREAFRELVLHDTRVDESTTYIFYYRGHGFTHPDRPQHFLYLDRLDPDYTIARADVLDCLAKRGARLSVLITDCCSHPLIASPDILSTMAVPGLKDLFSDLFLEPSGVVDLTASSFAFDPDTKATRGERAWCTAKGALFTIAFCETLLRRGAHDRLKDEAGTVTWEKAFEEIRDRTNERYVAMRRRYVDDENEVVKEVAALAPSEQTVQWLRDQPAQTPVGVFHLK